MRRFKVLAIVVFSAALLWNGWSLALPGVPVQAQEPAPNGESVSLLAVEISGTHQARVDQQPLVFTATVAPVTATFPITYVWQATGGFTRSGTISASSDPFSPNLADNRD